MHQSLTREEENIIVLRRKQIQNENNIAELPTLENVANANVVSTRNPMAELFLQPQAVQKNDNVTSDIVPFEANIDDFQDEEVPDFDLVSILDQVEKSQKTENVPNTQGGPMSMMSNQVVNNIPKSLFHNCTIQNITFNMKN